MKRKSPARAPAPRSADLDNQDIQALGRSIGKITLEKLFDFLSELLAIEQGNGLFYSLARDRARSPETREIFNRFLHQSETHVDLLQTAIRDLGGNPVHLSPAAEFQLHRFKLLRDMDVSGRIQEIADLENLLLTETKNHVDWSFLKSIIPFIEDPHAQDVLETIADPIEDEEEDHVAWIRHALNRRLLRSLAA